MLQKPYPRNKRFSVPVAKKLPSCAEGQVSLMYSLRKSRSGRIAVTRMSIPALPTTRVYLRSHRGLACEVIPDRGKIKDSLDLTVDAMYNERANRSRLRPGEVMTVEKKLRDFREGSTTFSEGLKAIVNDNETGIRMGPDWSGGGNLLVPRQKKRKSRPVTQPPKSIHLNISRTEVGVMLDLMSFVSDLNDANLFMIKEENVYAPHADACLHGITRGLDICQRLSIPAQQKGQSLIEFTYADVLVAACTKEEVTNDSIRCTINNAPVFTRSAGKDNYSFDKLIPQLSEKLINYGKDTQKTHRQVIGRRTLERT